MNPWKVLGIDETADKKSVKRAYAKLIKNCHPEDDSEGFQVIRTAYETALKQIKLLKNLDSTVDDTPVRTSEMDHDIQTVSSVTEETVNGLHDLNTGPEGATVFKKRDHFSEASELICSVRELLDNYQLRTQLSAWKELFNFETLWHIDTKSVFGDLLFEHLIEWHLSEDSDHHLSDEVWLCIDREFNWLVNETKFYSRYPEAAADLIFYMIRESAPADEKKKSLSTQDYFKMERDCSEEKKSFPLHLYLLVIVVVFKILMALSEVDNNKIEIPDFHYEGLKPTDNSKIEKPYYRYDSLKSTNSGFLHLPQ